MGRPSYVCATCSEHFTRKYSATRHNHNLHNGAAEIVRLIDYLAGRSSGQYTPNNPFWYKHYNPYDNIGSATIPDTVGNSFQPRYISQQAPSGTSQYYTSPIHRPLPTARETIIRIDELKRLANKYPQYCPEGLMQWAIFCCNDGDNKILDDKLDQLCTIDRRLNGWASPL